MRRSCDVCGAKYEAKRATSRYCSSNCRTKASRRSKAGRPVATSVVKLPASGSSPGELEQATLDELETAGRLETARGKAVVLLARGIDSAPPESGTSQAARFREWQSMLAKATAGTGTEKSAVDRMRDQLAERRARRAQGA